MATRTPPRPTTPQRSVDWALRILLASAFVSAGGLKLAGAAQFVALFDQIGVSQWFRLLTGAWEVTGGLLILVPRTALLGAVLLACVMVGALFTHAAIIGGNPLPAVVLLALCSGVLWLRRSQLTRS